MRNLRDLLATWENWYAREVSRRALALAKTEEARDAMRHALDQGDDIDPLNVLRDTTELVTLLTGWRWQAVRAAREQGESWEKIGAATGVTAKRAEVMYVVAIDCQLRREQDRGNDVGCSSDRRHSHPGDRSRNS